MLFCFFFFQAEDGIRDVAVTGVQTCALPILFPHPLFVMVLTTLRMGAEPLTAGGSNPPLEPKSTVRVGTHRMLGRSEERRVGEERRSRWSPYPYKKKKEKTPHEAT